MGSMAYMMALLEKRDYLRGLGLYEQALYEAWDGCRVNWHHMPQAALKLVFEMADRDKLFALGAPLEGPGPFRVYRGVNGKGAARRVNGYSWTIDLDSACWFAMRWEFRGHPAVFYRDVMRKDIYFRTNERGESEFVCVPLPSRSKPRRLAISRQELQERAERLTAARQEENRKVIAKGVTRHAAAKKQV